MIRTADADVLGARAAGLAHAGDATGAVALLAEQAEQRNSFALLDRAGRILGAVPLERLDPIIEGLVASGAIGAWPVIGSALGAASQKELEPAMARCRELIASAGLWYSTDILGERVPGPALVTAMPLATAVMAPWRLDQNRWVRRAVGVAVHYWTKRVARRPGGKEGCLFLLEYLRPMLGERQIDAAKGVGWALKTMGRYQPETLTDWLTSTGAGGKSRPGPVVMRKAVMYLPAGSRVALLAQ